MQEAQNICKGCGECCLKGGPLLHREDMPLLKQGHVPFSALVTLRGGELAHDPVLGRLAVLEEEAVKLAGTGEQGHPWHCVFHKGQSCAIHAHRPAQCRALFCTDTEALIAMYAEARATRRDVLALAPAGWLELAEAHEEQCPLRPLVPLAALVTLPELPEEDELSELGKKTGAVEKGGAASPELFRTESASPELASAEQNEAVQNLLECVRYDLAFRELSVERAGMPPEVLPCVLGRPVADFLRTLGLMVHKAGEELRIRRLRPSHYPW